MRAFRFLILMGVSGSGKTSVGKTLAEHFGWDFYDADDFHPPENVAKMASNIGELAPAGPGHRHIMIHPGPGVGLSHASARHLTPYGIAECSWIT